MVPFVSGKSKGREKKKILVSRANNCGLTCKTCGLPAPCHYHAGTNKSGARECVVSVASHPSPGVASTCYCCTASAPSLVRGGQHLLLLYRQCTVTCQGWPAPAAAPPPVYRRCGPRSNTCCRHCFFQR